jgi:protein vein
MYETLNEIRANISVASNRNRRESRFHHPTVPPQQHRNRDRQRRRRYCSARDPRTLAFEAPTVFEGKIKSMTPDRQANFSVTVEILKVHKQQANFTLPRQVRLQFAYRNASECDIYREEFRHRGFVRDELEQGKIYFLFVKQISLGNFTILGQPIKKISRTAKDVEIGVSERYGE